MHNSVVHYSLFTVSGHRLKEQNKNKESCATFRRRMTIAEIAYEAGFNNPKNFTKYFKEEFKVLPSPYSLFTGFR